MRDYYSIQKTKYFKNLKGRYPDEYDQLKNIRV